MHFGILFTLCVRLFYDIAIDCNVSEGGRKVPAATEQPTQITRCALETLVLWQVEVPKDNRHRDRPIVQDIYTALDKFLATRQSRLKY